MDPQTKFSIRSKCFPKIFLGRKLELGNAKKLLFLPLYEEYNE